MRVRVAIIADDLSGANATGALFRARGLRTLSVLDHTHAASYLDGHDALAIDADSRGLDRFAAYERVRRLAAELHEAGVPLIGKRIDSTLRGNLGAEIEALLDGGGARSLALVVAAVPALGRITAGGYLLVQGVPLLETAAADPWDAPASSVVAEVIAAQSHQRPTTLNITDLSGGSAALRQRLRALIDSGVRIVVADACTDAHLELLARAAEGLPVLPVDPGPFSAALAWQRFGGTAGALPVLAVAGSVTRKTQDQISELAGLPGAALIAIDAATLLGDGAQAEIERAVNRLAGAADASVLVLSSAHTREAVLDLRLLAGQGEGTQEAAARRIAAGLAEVVSCYLGCGRGVAGIYTTGGAVTQAVAHRLGAAGLEIEREIVPLAVLGRLRGGRYGGLPFVSKGGLVGDHRAAVCCVEALRGGHES